MSGKFCAPVDVILCETKTAVQTLSVIGRRSDPVATSAVQVWLVIDTDERIEVTRENAISVGKEDDDADLAANAHGASTRRHGGSRVRRRSSACVAARQRSCSRGHERDTRHAWAAEGLHDALAAVTAARSGAVVLEPDHCEAIESLGRRRDTAGVSVRGVALNASTRTCPTR